MADRLVTANRLKAVAALLLLGIIAASPLVRGCDHVAGRDDAFANSQTRAIEIAGRTFELELALTDEQRYQGLSGRASIPADGGMLFVFPGEGQRSFVMRDCLVPIDLIYLSGDERVVRTHEMTVEPPGTPEGELKRYRSGDPAQYVIELKGGTLDGLDLAVGDPVDIPDDLKARAQ